MAYRGRRKQQITGWLYRHEVGEPPGAGRYPDKPTPACRNIANNLHYIRNNRSNLKGQESWRYGPAKLLS